MLFRGDEFIHEHFAVVADDLAAHAAVVVLVPDRATAACIVQLVGDQRLLVPILVVLPVHDLATWGLLALEGTGASHRRALLLAGPTNIPGVTGCASGGQSRRHTGEGPSVRFQTNRPGITPGFERVSLRLSRDRGNKFFPSAPLAHLGLRVRSQRATTSSRPQAYQDFFALWNGADADGPC